MAAPLLLDEGIDVLAADLGIVLAASSSRRQMVQRMGRVLRKKEDGRLARLAVLYVHGTAEDPAQGGQESFIDMISDVAHDQQIFGPGESGIEICRYLNNWLP